MGSGSCRGACPGSTSVSQGAWCARYGAIGFSPLRPCASAGEFPASSCLREIGWSWGLQLWTGICRPSGAWVRFGRQTHSSRCGLSSCGAPHLEARLRGKVYAGCGQRTTRGWRFHPSRMTAEASQTDYSPLRHCGRNCAGWGHPAMCVNLIFHRSKTPCRQVAESACVGCLQVDEQCADHLTTDVAAGSPVPRSTTRSRGPRRTPATDSQSPRVSPQGEKSSASRSTLSINSEVRIFACIHALADASLLFGTCPKSKRLFNLLNTSSTCHRLR